jgi:arginase family enzyme
MSTVAVVFPFDLFGSAGSGAGAELLSDALREMVSDSRRENRPARGHAYQDHLRIREFKFETMDELKSWRKTGRQAARQAWKQGNFLLWLGGNHLGVLPVYEELGKKSLVLQLDAHLDIYNLSDCTEELSHGNFLLHAEGPLPKIITSGHRDLFLMPGHIAKHYKKTFSAADVVSEPERVLTELTQAAENVEHVFLDIDCDVFDPAYFPGTTHSLPFGLAPSFVIRLVHAVGIDRFCGMALSEFDPGRDVRDQSLSTLIWLMEWMLLKMYESK